MPRTNTMPVVMYPEGVIVGKVQSGRQRTDGPVRHVAFGRDGQRIGTFDTFKDAKEALETVARAS